MAHIDDSLLEWAQGMMKELLSAWTEQAAELAAAETVVKDLENRFRRAESRLKGALGALRMAEMDRDGLEVARANLQRGDVQASLAEAARTSSRSGWEHTTNRLLWLLRRWELMEFYRYVMGEAANDAAGEEWMIEQIGRRLLDNRGSMGP